MNSRKLEFPAPLLPRGHFAGFKVLRRAGLPVQNSSEISCSYGALFCSRKFVSLHITFAYFCMAELFNSFWQSLYLANFDFFAARFI